MGLNGIDISSWQDDLVVSAMGSCDFVIVKATGGKGYSNGCFKRHADQTLAAGKLLGCNHYARDRGYEGTAEQEADHFIAASPSQTRWAESPTSTTRSSTATTRRTARFR